MEFHFARHLQINTQITNAMKTLKALIICVVAGLTSASAQNTGEIHGRLVDNTGEPIPFATVIAKAGTKEIGTYTDDDGRFKIKPLQPCNYTVAFSSIGLASRELAGVQVDADKIKNMGRLVLQPGTYIIEDAIIETYKDKLIEYDGTTMNVLRAEEIRNSPAARNPATLVASMSSDIFQSPVDGQLYFRGSRGGNVQYFVDGVKMTTDPSIPTSGLSSVMVYSGGVPAKFGDCTGGFVIMETKNYADMYNAYIAKESRKKPGTIPVTDDETEQ